MKKILFLILLPFLLQAQIIKEFQTFRDTTFKNFADSTRSGAFGAVGSGLDSSEASGIAHDTADILRAEWKNNIEDSLDRLDDSLSYIYTEAQTKQVIGDSLDNYLSLDSTTILNKKRDVQLAYWSFLLEDGQEGLIDTATFGMISISTTDSAVLNFSVLNHNIESGISISIDSIIILCRGDASSATTEIETIALYENNNGTLTLIDSDVGFTIDETLQRLKLTLSAQPISLENALLVKVTIAVDGYLSFYNVITDYTLR